MSFWSDWVNSIKQLPGAILGASPAAVVQQAAPSFIPTQVADGKVITPQVQAGAKAAQTDALRKAGVAPLGEGNIAAPVNDPVLWLGDKAEKYVFSPIVARPISTFNLLTDPTSQLYKDGFQWSDVKDAYNRSADVSLGQSMLKSPFTLLGPIESKILGMNGIDVSKIDLWNDKDIQKNFVDNTLGKWITGTNDFIIKNVAIGALTDGASAAVKAGAVKAGLTTTLKTADIEALPKLEQDIYSHIDNLEGNPTGVKTVIGQDIQDLAASTNIIDITRIVEKHSFNSELPNLIMQTNEPRIVADFLLADKGYGPAIERLATLGRSDDLWVIGDGTATFQGNYLTTGKLPTYTAEQRNRWMQAFDDAIKKDPKHKEIFDTFLTQELDASTGALNVESYALGKAYRPIEPKGFQGPAAKVRSYTGKLKTAAMERDFTNPELGGFVHATLGGGLKYPTTVLMRYVGTYMPKGFITNSGLQPMNGIRELISTFDDVPLFRDGTKLIETHDFRTMSVSDYRLEAINKFTNAANDGERAAVIKQFNTDLAKTIAHSRGYYDSVQIESMVDKLMEDVYAVHGDLSKTGFAMDPSGVRISVDPQTMRQLASSMPVLPFGDLDRMILQSARREKNVVAGAATKGKQVTANGAKSVFEMANRAFSVAQLYRFSYVPKNSIFEPLLSATLAEGSKFTTPMFTEAPKAILKEGIDFISRNVAKSRTLLPSAKNEIQRELNALSKQYAKAIGIRDQVYSSYASMFEDVAGVSPATKRDWADTIRASLKAAEKDVAAIEGKINTYTIDYGKPFDVPSVYNLRARIETLKAAGSVRYASEIRTAELTLQKAIGNINTLAPELNVLNDEIVAAYAKIGKVLEEIGPKNVEKARLFSVAEGQFAKKPYLSETQRVQLSNGQTLEFPNFASRNGFGEGYMSEIANNNTRTLELLGNKATVAKINTIFSRGPKNTTAVADPAYFDELAYIVNNHMRGDVLVDRIIAGQSRAQIITEWSKTSQARWYAEQRGLNPSDIESIIDDQIGYVNRYLPTFEAKRLASQGAVGPEGLRGVLGDKLDQMVPIHPLDIEYARPTTLAKNIAASADSILANSWKFFMKPENLIREVWGTSRHTAIVAEKAEALLAQGYDIDLSTLNRLHHASAIQVADEVSKVFYTIPRQSRALYMARGFATFPNAAASGIYRYAKFAVKSPSRFAKFTNSYYSYYGSFGVDQYGNPVDDPMKAKYLMIPGTKELGLNGGKGVIINARATNYMMNFPGASWIVPIAVSAILAGKPDNTPIVKDVIDKTFGKVPGFSFDEIFPYGANPDVGSQTWQTFTPAWARNLVTGLRADKTEKMFVDSWISESNAQWAEYEMAIAKDPNYKGAMPTEKSILDAAKNLYIRKARTEMFSILGTPQVINMKPDRIYQDYYYNAYNTFKAQGKNDVEALKLAEDQFQNYMLGTRGAKFPMDRLFVQSEQATTYITPSKKAYDRIWKDFPGLATALRQVDPSVVGLMVADLPKEYSPQVNKFLNSTTATLPDGTYLNSRLSNPTLVEEEIDKSRYWKAYSDYKNTLNDAAKNAGYASYLSVPELKTALSDYANKTLKAGSKVWYDEYAKGASTGNSAYLQSQGLFTAISDQKFMTAYGNTQFWQHAKAFVTYRNQYASAYKDAPSGSKQYVSDAWQLYLASTLKDWDPTLQKMINRYFINDNLRENK